MPTDNLDDIARGCCVVQVPSPRVDVKHRGSSVAGLAHDGGVGNSAAVALGHEACSKTMPGPYGRVDADRAGTVLDHGRHGLTRQNARAATTWKRSRSATPLCEPADRPK